MIGSADIVVPSVVGGRYVLRERIGRGGVADVYRARDLRRAFLRDVCVKLLGGAASPELARAMEEEARLLASVRHSNVVSLVDVGRDHRDAPFLVLELIDGANLCALTRALAAAAPAARFESRGLLPDPVAVHVACAVLRALAAVQRVFPGLVHRDVTPHNVLVSYEGELKLADFGIALALDRARWTRPSMVKGKIAYLSPEHAAGEELDPRADLFAVGVILYELLARVRPWPTSQGGGRAWSEMRAIARGDVMPLERLRPDLPAAFVALVHRLIAHDRAARFATPEDALRALAPFSAGDLGSLRLASIIDRLRDPAAGEL